MVARPTISEVLAEFLAERDQSTKKRPYTARRSIVELLESCMDSYAHDSLTPDEAEMCQLRWEADEEANSFSRTFGPKRILGMVGPFLDWFIIRKVLGGPEIAESAGPVVRELLDWMESKGYASGRALESAREAAVAATENLPKADRLSSMLYELTESQPLGPVIEERDIDYDVVTISRSSPVACGSPTRTRARSDR